MHNQKEGHFIKPKLNNVLKLYLCWIALKQFRRVPRTKQRHKGGKL